MQFYKKRVESILFFCGVGNVRRQGEAVAEGRGYIRGIVTVASALYPFPGIL